MIEDLVQGLDALADILPGPPLAYLVIFALVALDVFLPVIPSEASMLVAGTLAATGRLDPWLVLAAGALGAFAGDNAAYLVGRGVGPRVRRWLVRGGGRLRVEWAERQIERRGGYLIVVGRFLPWGRSAVALAAGMLRMPWPRYVAFEVVAAILWVVQAFVPGYIGGVVFRDSPWLGVLLGWAIVLLAGLALALARSARARLRSPRAGA